MGTDLEKCLCSWYCHHMESRQCFCKIQNLSYKKESGPRGVGSDEENTMELTTEYIVLKTDIPATLYKIAEGPWGTGETTVLTHIN